MVIEGLKTVTQLDLTSKSILPIIRYFYLSLNEPFSHGWRHGFDCAVGTWGQNRGLAIANATQKFVYDLLRCDIILTIFVYLSSFVLPSGNAMHCANIIAPNNFFLPNF